MKLVGLICYILFTCLEISLACSPTAANGNETYFEKLVYKAAVTDHRIEIIDGPIKLSKCNSTNVQFEVKSDESKYYPFFASYSTSNCFLVFYGLVRESVTTEDTLYDVLTLSAYLDDYITTTSIIIINFSEYDPYKLLYNVNGTEYVILNYFYFKLFLLIIVVIGILILVLELREIVTKYKVQTSFQSHVQTNEPRQSNESIGEYWS